MDGERVAEDYGATSATNNFGAAASLAHHYFQNDYQNTIGLVTTDNYVFGSAATTPQNEGSDVFGQPRGASGKPNPDPNWGANDVTKRRYINQEDLTDAQLIDLNARVYDPLFGKFLSPDPIISDQDDSQSWNAYAYSHNNPMSGEDPTGLEPDENPACQGDCGQGTAPGKSLGGGVSYDAQHNALYVPAGTSMSVAGAIAGAIQSGGSHGAAAGAAETGSLSVSPGLSGQYHIGSGGPPSNQLAANTTLGKVVQGVATVATDAVGQIPIGAAEVGSEGFQTPALPAEEVGDAAAARAVGKAAGDVADSAAEVGGKLASNVAKSIRSYEKQIASHLEKLARFRTNPTVRPGMEHLPEETIRAAQQSRIEHLEREIRAFEGNIAKLLGGS